MATAKKAVEKTEEIVAESISQIEQDWQQIRKKEREEANKRRAETLNDLYEPFPVEVERKLKKGGAQLTYIPVSEVINRMNRVLGFDGWSYEIIKCERDALDPEFIVAHVRMTVFSETDRLASVTKDGFGGQKIKRTKQGDIVDLGDEFKGAVSDALKKAAQALGVGLYLARTEEAMEAEETYSQPVPKVDPEIEEMWASFTSLVGAFSADGKAQLNKFWSEHAGTRPKPTLATANKDDLQALIGECIRISFNGEAQSDE